MEHLLRDRRLSFLALTAACASVPAAVIHFFGTVDPFLPTRFSGPVGARGAGAGLNNVVGN